MSKHKHRKGCRHARARASRANVAAVVGIVASLLFVGTQLPPIIAQYSAQEGESAKAELQPATSIEPLPVLQPAAPDVREFEEARRHLGFQKENLENRTRELQNNFRGSNVDVSGAQQLLAEMAGILNRMEQALNGVDLQGFWNINGEIGDIQWDIDDTFRNLYDQQAYASFEKEIAGREEEVQKNMARQIKDLERNAKGGEMDLSSLQALVATYEDALASIRQRYEALSPTDLDLSDAIEDLRYELYNSMDFRDFYDLFNELQEASNMVNQRKDIERVMKDLERGFKDKERTVKDFERAKLDVGGLQLILQQMHATYDQTKELVASPGFDPQDFWDLNGAFNDLDKDFWDLNSLLQEERNKVQSGKDADRILKEKGRMLKDMDRECVRAKCSGSALEVQTELRAIYDRMTGAVSTGDFEAFWSENSEFDYLQRDFWDALNVVQENRTLGRWLKDITRELKDKARWVRDLEQQAKRGNTPSEPVRELQPILGEMEEAARRANDAYQTGDYDTAQEIMNVEFQNLQQQFDIITFSLQEAQQGEFQRKELLQLQREIADAEKRVTQLLAKGKIGNAHAELCLSYIEEGKGYAEQLLALFEGGNQDIAEEVQIRFEELGRRAEKDCAFLFEGGRDYAAYTETFVPVENRGMADEILQKLTDSLADLVINALSMNSSLFNQIVESVGNRYQEQIARTLEATSFLPQEAHNELLSRKTSLLEEIARLEDEVEELQILAEKERGRLTAIREQLATHSFISEEGTRVEEEIEEFLAEVPTLDPAEVRERVADLEEIAAGAIERDAEIAYEEGLAPFVDTRIGSWYTPYAATAKEDGFVQGTGVSDGAEFDPDGLTNVAEVITMIGRIVGIDELATAGSRIGMSVPGWAHGAAATLEGYNGLDLDSIFGVNAPSDAVTRLQVARLLRVVFVLPDGGASQFGDVGRLSDDDQRAVGAVAEAGIMTGQGDGSQFDPDGLLNRAQLAAILTRVTGASR
jgi:hypothetical protein